MTTLTPEIETHWLAVQPILTIHNPQEYEQAVAHLNALIDEVGTWENHPLYELLDTLGILIQAYEDTHFPMPTATGVEAIQYLMEEHNLRQADLSQIGSQGVVSEILNGKRELNVRQIRALAERFHVSPAVFI